MLNVNDGNDMNIEQFGVRVVCKYRTCRVRFLHVGSGAGRMRRRLPGYFISRVPTGGRATIASRVQNLKRNGLRREVSVTLLIVT